MEDSAFSGLSTDGMAAEEEEGVRTVPWPAVKRGRWRRWPCGNWKCCLGWKNGENLPC